MWLYVCILALFIQLAKRLRGFICRLQPDFREKRLDIKCVFWFSLQHLSERFLIRKRIERDIIVNVHTSSWKVLVILVRFNETLIFWDRYEKNPKVWNFMQIRPVGDELFHADWLTFQRECGIIQLPDICCVDFSTSEITKYCWQKVSSI